LQSGRIDQEQFAADPSLRSLIDVVPFGISAEPPNSGAPVLKGVVPGIGRRDRVLLWPGGIWNWFDPLTVIDAVAELAGRRDDVRLFFLGLRHPNPHVPVMRMARLAIERAEKLGLRDRVVFFHEGWIPYEQRGAYLLEADVGVSAHFEDLESRFAFRTRLLDCFWAGLPVVTTTGDVLGDLVERRGLGRALPPRDVRAWVDALETLLDDTGAREQARAAIAEVREEFVWSRVVEPLRGLVREPGAPIPRRRTLGPGASWVEWRLRHAVADRGVRGAAVRATQIAKRRLP
jgi:glycosyltransferase involved in cell wall biosynthesis